MAFERKIWKSRQSEHPNRRKLTAAGNEGEYDVERAEGLILEDGDPFDQDTMNDLEGRIADGIAESGLFACTLLADGWQAQPAEGGGDETEESGGEAAAAQAEGETGGGEGSGEATTPAVTVYTQTVTCPGLLAAYDVEAPQVPTTGVQATDAALKEGLDALCEAGNSGETLDGQLSWTCYGSHPTVDLPLRLRRAAAKSAPDAGGEPETPAGPGGGEQEEAQPDENL